MTKEEILYEKTGLIYTEHPKVMEAMTEFADTHLKEQFAIYGVSQRSKLLIGLLTKLEKEGGNNFIDKQQIVSDYLKDN